MATAYYELLIVPSLKMGLFFSLLSGPRSLSKESQLKCFISH